MALLAGTIDVTDPNAVTGTGLAFELFEGFLAAATPENKAKVAANMKPMCEALGARIVDYFVANADVTVVVHTTDAGLQTTPNPNNPATATAGPASNKTLTGTIA